METMTQAQLEAWLRTHNPAGTVVERGRKNNERIVNAKTGFSWTPDDGPELAKKEVDSTTITAMDGATVTIRRIVPEGAGSTTLGPIEAPVRPEFDVVERNEKSDGPAPRTSTQQAADEEDLTTKKNKNAQEAREEAEREYNFQNPRPGQPRAYRETNAERAKREYDELQQHRQEEQDKRDAETRRLAAENQTKANEIAAGNLQTSQGHLAIAQAAENRAANKPDFLSTADAKNPNIVRYNPTSGVVETMANPNYDKAKEESAEMRANLALQIQSGQLKLEEAKQQYTQWFDANVKTPLALAQEARDKAAEQRAALDAEERRRQFASTFSLQKGELGQRAGAAAMQAEESLLPYRAGPNEAAHMADAVNGLAAGGSMSTNAGAGIHFEGGDFQFDAPDFRSIAKQAAKDALKGISSYIPSDQSYSTADYSGVPQVNTGGAPSFAQSSADVSAGIDKLNQRYQYAGQ